MMTRRTRIIGFSVCISFFGLFAYLLGMFDDAVDIRDLKSLKEVGVLMAVALTGHLGLRALEKKNPEATWLRYLHYVLVGLVLAGFAILA